VAKPESLAVIDEDLEGGTGAVAEDEQAPAERIGFQALSAEAGQPIDARPEIDRLRPRPECACAA
jgi:hypothetical protein